MHISGAYLDLREWRRRCGKESGSGQRAGLGLYSRPFLALSARGRRAAGAECQVVLNCVSHWRGIGKSEEKNRNAELVCMVPTWVRGNLQRQTLR